MSKLAEVAERLAETRRWLDQEASRLAARLDQLEKRAPIAIQTAHRLLDEQLRGLDETERMVQQWMSATADLANAAKAKPQPAQAAAASPVVATPPKPLEKPKESPPVPFDPAEPLFEEQHEYVEKLERALQTMANDPPEPHVDAARADAVAHVKGPGETTPARDPRRVPTEQQSAAHLREEGGLERALQTLANMPRPRVTPFGHGGASAPELPQKADEIFKPPKAEGAPKQQKAEGSESKPQKAEDASKQQPRKLGVVRVA
jgi:hypothetical protein